MINFWLLKEGCIRVAKGGLTASTCNFASNGFAIN
jgi:hypothetical protein